MIAVKNLDELKKLDVPAGTEVLLTESGLRIQTMRQEKFVDLATVTTIGDLADIFKELKARGWEGRSAEYALDQVWPRGER